MMNNIKNGMIKQDEDDFDECTDHKFSDWVDVVTYLKKLGLEIDISFDKLSCMKERALVVAYEVIDDSEFENGYKQFKDMDKKVAKDSLNITYSLTDNFIRSSRPIKVATLSVSANLDEVTLADISLWDTNDGIYPILLNEYINDILKKERRTTTWLSEQTNINQQSLYGKLKNNTFSAIDIIKIGKVLDIDLNSLKDNLLLE